jgi:hypothetical protein
MTRNASRSPRLDGRDPASRASLVFRDFVRLLEKLDARPRRTAPKVAREGSR